jgi:magnesium-transporting ATPase (P-type)
VQLTYIYALRVSESGWRDGLTRNALLHWAILVSVVLQFLVVTSSIGNRLFATIPLSIEQWLVAIGLSILSFLLIVAISTRKPSRPMNK